MQRKQIQETHDKLLEAMARSLGYKEQVTWKTIQNLYIPQRNVGCHAATAEHSGWARKMGWSSRAVHESFLFRKCSTNERTC